ncbi:hypothetical protein I4U23_025975 [Adineta vaga]|nr:hypothetical protein I4U23_025975 [Adineta vaga]
MSCLDSHVLSNVDTIREKNSIKQHEKERKNDDIDCDPAIISFGRYNDNQVRRDRVFFLRLFCVSKKQSDDLFYIFKHPYEMHTVNQQLINVVDQMIAQSHIPFSLLPKHFKPKWIVKQRETREEPLQNSYRSLSFNNFSVKSNNYYRRNKTNCIRDDHRINTGITE